jgi:uncharacterized repeat protein (TIGR03803 family)
MRVRAACSRLSGGIDCIVLTRKRCVVRTAFGEINPNSFTTDAACAFQEQNFSNYVAIRLGWIQLSSHKNLGGNMDLRKWKLLGFGAAMITIGCVTVSAQTLTTLHSFSGSDGQFPEATLLQGSDGNFYGMTALGGANSKGTAFKITATGTLTTLHSFSGFPTDGAVPVAGLAQGSFGIFYGTTAYGGLFYQGAVFGMTPSGVAVVLHAFNSLLGEGAFPTAGLVRGSDGNFYGTTVSGGAHFKGTVFKVSAIGSLTTLHSFGGSSGDGAVPVAGLVQGSDGNFYGTTTSGGTHSQGTVFRITPAGVLTVLHSLSGSPGEGAVPFAALVQGSDGNFYGTTALGGAHSKGTVFKIDATGTLTTLHSFSGSPNDGGNPIADVVQGTDGNFYGTTALGGAHSKGTVFAMDVTGNLTTLHSFSGSPGEGALPFAGLVQGSDGNFYGATASGGAHGKGTVFKFSSSSSNN